MLTLRVSVSTHVRNVAAATQNIRLDLANPEKYIHICIYINFTDQRKNKVNKDLAQ